MEEIGRVYVYDIEREPELEKYFKKKEDIPLKKQNTISL